MTDRRELEGIGCHHLDHNDDCLLVDQWTKRPDDLTGQTLTINKLLPREIRCTNLQEHPRKFRFRIIIEIDKIAVDNR